MYASGDGPVKITLCALLSYIAHNHSVKQLKNFNQQEMINFTPCNKVHHSKQLPHLYSFLSELQIEYSPA